MERNDFGFAAKAAVARPACFQVRLSASSKSDTPPRRKRPSTSKASRIALSEGRVVGDTMKLPRRRFLHLAAGAAALPISSYIASAQTYPARPIRIVVGYAPGGGTDIFVRLVGQPLSERLGQPLVIENRPGAASNVATEAVVRAPADGYTLLGFDAAAAINATLYDKLNFNVIRDIAAVGLIRGPLLLIVHPSVPANSVPEFIAYARANPGRISMASAGSGNPTHMAGELFKVMTRIEMTHVPYRGAGPAITDLLGGQVQVYFGSLPATIEHIRAGKLRALAATTSTRFEGLPDMPTVSEFIPGYEAAQWFAIGLRKSTPAEMVDKLDKEINVILADPKMKVRLAELGTTAFAGSSADLDKFIAEETEKWAKVVKLSGAKPE
jgi:tripartite-type tricarboxylate transporter receptor subunit TctC